MVELIEALPLDDPRWNAIDHCYGPASNIPGLLQQLAVSPGAKANHTDEPFFTLWSSLCHQDDVYAASYAASPHFIRIALETSGPVAFDVFALPTAIEISRRNGKGPTVPAFLETAYNAGLRQLPRAVAAHINDPWDESQVQVIAAALAISKGSLQLAEALSNLDPDWIERIIADNR
jgi:hypothetical protein